MMKKSHRCVIGALVLAIVICAGPDSPAQQFELRIDVADSMYFVCEPIWLDAELTNMGEDTVRVWGFEFPGGGRLNIVVTDEQGDTLPWRYESFYGAWPGLILNPGETYFEAFALSEIFFSADVPPPVPLYTVHAGSLAPGRYQVTAGFEPRYGGDTVSASTISFSVVEPTGAERQALELFLEVHKSVASFDDDKTSQLMAQLLATYPKSVYVERALKRVRNYEKLLDKRPNSGYLDAYVHWTVKGIADEGEKRSFLEGIIQEHSGTRVARFAEQRLRRLERGE